MSNNEPQQNTALFESVMFVKEYGGLLLRNWKYIAAAIALSLVLNFIRFKFQHTRFQADLSFMVNEDEASKVSGLSSALEDIGFGFGSGGSEYNLEKIMELMRSRRIVFETLMERETIDGEEDYLANHLIREHDLHDIWKKKKRKLSTFLFTRDSMEVFNKDENSALQELYKVLMGKYNKIPPVIGSEILDLPGIMSLSITSRNEEFSYYFSEHIFNNLSRFYIDKTTEKQQKTYLLVSTETDSIRQVLASKEYELAAFEDRNQSLIGNRVQLKKERLEREILILSTMYGEAVANEEVAKFELRKKTPFIQSIDEPVFPLKRVRKSLSSMMMKAFLLGLFLSVLIIIGRKVFTDVMTNFKETSPNRE